jgi:hypothetical protein
MKIKKKSTTVMKDYIALHGLLPNNELPKKLRGKIPKDEIWIREDVYDNKFRLPWIKFHEVVETNIMKTGKSYKYAHKWAEIADGFW